MFRRSSIPLVHALSLSSALLTLAPLMGCPNEEDSPFDALESDAALTPDAGPLPDAAPPLDATLPLDAHFPRDAEGLLDAHARGDAALDGAAVVRPTHSGLISVQELSFAAADAGQGLTVQALLTAATRPDYEEHPGQPTGCKAWSYDLSMRAPAPVEDHGTLTIDGLTGGPLHCEFAAGRGYACDQPPVASGDFLARAFVPREPLALALTPGGGRAFALPTTSVMPGEPFVLDDASRALITELPTDGRAITLSCAGAGGSCGSAMATIVRINTTDASLSGHSATDMPPPVNRYVEISCATIGGDTVTVPAAAMALLASAHAVSPITRIRTAFMRDGVALFTPPPPAVPNRLVLAAGRGAIGITEP